MKHNNGIVLINIICSLLQQVVVTISGFILPRLIINVFGSEVNGLISSLTQFLSYISLIEGGLTGVVAANFYKPLTAGDDVLLSRVIKTASNFYKKIALIFFCYTVVIALLYPLVVKSNFSFSYIFTLTFILSINFIVQYLFSITWKTLLSADKKGYLVSLSYILVVILNTVISCLIIHFYPNIKLVKLVSAAIYLIQPLIYHLFIKKHYKITKKIDTDNELLAQRWDGFAINIAAFVHNNTDVVILTLMASLSDVSVYAVYLMVVNGLKSIVMAVSQAIVPSIGFAYAKGNKTELDIAFNKYEFVVLFLTYFLFTVGGLCISPFIGLYTSGITDYNYNQPVFAWILVVSELIYCAKEPYLMMAYSANKFKEFKKIAYIEAAINICVSVSLVKFLGITGVAIGTLIAMTFRTVCQIVYLHHQILERSFFQLFYEIFFYSICMVLIIYVSRKIFEAGDGSVFNWISYAVKNSVLAISVFGMISVFIYCKKMRRK